MKQEIEKICKNCIYWEKYKHLNFTGMCNELNDIDTEECFFCKDFTEKEEKPAEQKK